MKQNVCLEGRTHRRVRARAAPRTSNSELSDSENSELYVRAVCARKRLCVRPAQHTFCFMCLYVRLAQHTFCFMCLYARTRRTDVQAHEANRVLSQADVQAHEANRVLSRADVQAHEAKHVLSRTDAQTRTRTNGADVKF